MKYAKIFLSLLISSLSVASDLQSSSSDNFTLQQARSLGTFMGLLELIEGTNDLIKNHVDDPIVGVQHIVGGVVRLIETGTQGVEIEPEERFKIIAAINDFKDQINLLAQQIVSRASNDQQLNKPDSDTASEVERQKMIEGLNLILHNVIYILVDPKSIGTALTKILSGIYMVISAILANGKVDSADWGRLLNALASILNLKYMRIFEIPNEMSRLGIPQSALTFVD